MDSQLARRFLTVEIFGFYALALCLPLAETPMHIAFIFLVLGAMGWRLTSFAWRKPDFFEWLLLSMSAIALASTIINWPLIKGFSGFRNYVTLYVLFWIAYRSRYSREQMQTFFWLVVASIVFGLLYGLWELQSGVTTRLELHSAGVVTQSSIYLGEAFFIMLGGYLDRTSFVTAKFRSLLFLCILFAGAGLFVMGSRGSLLGVGFGLLLMVVLRPFSNKRFFWAVGCVSALLLLAVNWAIMSSPQRIPLVSGIRHLRPHLDLSDIDSAVNRNDLVRYENWLIGYWQATNSKHPLLGIGPRNYESILIEELPWASTLKSYPHDWQKLQHAHNLFLTKWCEEGILGLLVFLLFLGRIGWLLLRECYETNEPRWYLVAGLGSMVVFIVAGSFNSPFNNEFAWLAMLVMGYAIRRTLHETSNEVGLAS